MDESRSCGLCQYWAPVWTLNLGNGDMRSKRGGCHRHAPRSSALTQSWPVTKSDQWCGEFEARDNERRGSEKAKSGGNPAGDASGGANGDAGRS